jgi:Fe-S-cluster containining protein
MGMQGLEAELERAQDLDVDALADAIESIGFECTRCGACCTRDGDDPHTATVFPDEVRAIETGTDDLEWRDIARPMPFGLDESGGETFEWALQTDACGDCRFHEEFEYGTGGCSIYDERPLICQTYPFSVALGGTSQPLGEAVDREGLVRAHECEGLGRDIDREKAEQLAAALKERAVVELQEAMGVRDNYEPVSLVPNTVVVHDSEGAKYPDGRPYERS